MTDRSICPDLSLLEEYVLDPATAGGETSEHIGQCPRCRLWVQRRTDELQQLAEIWFGDERPDVIRLEPFSIDDKIEHAAPTVLAAEGVREGDTPDALELASPDHEVLLRIVRGSESSNIWLYVIAGNPEQCARVVVRPFGGDKEYLTDAEGRVNLGPGPWPTAPERTAEIHLPRARFHLTELDDITDTGQTAELRSPEGGRIALSYTGRGRNRRLVLRVLEVPKALADIPVKVAVRESGGLSVLDTRIVVDDQASFAAGDAVGDVEIYLYQ